MSFRSLILPRLITAIVLGPILSFTALCVLLGERFVRRAVTTAGRLHALSGRGGMVDAGGQRADNGQAANPSAGVAPLADQRQPDWRFCLKCKSLFFDGSQ